MPPTTRNVQDAQASPSEPATTRTPTQRQRIQDTGGQQDGRESPSTGSPSASDQDDAQATDQDQAAATRHDNYPADNRALDEADTHEGSSESETTDFQVSATPRPSATAIISGCDLPTLTTTHTEFTALRQLEEFARELAHMGVHRLPRLPRSTAPSSSTHVFALDSEYWHRPSSSTPPLQPSCNIADTTAAATNKWRTRRPRESILQSTGRWDGALAPQRRRPR